MIKELEPFDGFNPEIFDFLEDLKRNNNIEWFHANKKRYQGVFVSPAKSFVSSIAPFINRLNPAIRTEPKFDKTLMRINKDMRFNKGEPYRTWFLIHFGRFRGDSKFYVHFEDNIVQTGLHIKNSNEKDIFFRENLKKSGNELEEIFEYFKLNDRFGFYRLEKKPVPVIPRFNFSKHKSEMAATKEILLQTTGTFDEMMAGESNFVIKTSELFSLLYPVFIFSAFANPAEEINRIKNLL